MMCALWWLATVQVTSQPSAQPVEGEMSTTAKWLIGIGIVVVLLVVGYFGGKARAELQKMSGEYLPPRM